MYQLKLSEYHTRQTFLNLELIEKELRSRHLDQYIKNRESDLSKQILTDVEMKNLHYFILQSALLKHQLVEFRQELLFVQNAIRHLTIKESLKTLNP